MRLQKYMALCGVASRRRSEDLIALGYVKVNDTVITQMGYIVDEDKDIVSVNNIVITKDEEKHYYVFNKPRQVITTAYDEKERKRVLDYFTDIDARLFTVGRLDYDSSGLIFVTNDGEFANRVTHPKYECIKTYNAYIAGHISKDQVSRLKKGVIIDGYLTSPANIQLGQVSTNMQFMQIAIKEGRNRQIRKMIESVGAQVDSLERVAIGTVKFSSIKLGEYRILTQEEIDYFYSLKATERIIEK